MKTEPQGKPANKGFLSIANDFEYLVSAAALLGLVVMLTVSIVARYIAGMSVPWSEEVARFLFVAVIFASISYTARQHRHIRITLFVEKLFPERSHLYIFTIGDIVWLCFNAVVLYGAYEVITDMFRYPDRSAVLNVPLHFIYMLIPIFYLTFSFRIFQGIRARWRGEKIDSAKEELL